MLRMEGKTRISFKLPADFALAPHSMSSLLDMEATRTVCAASRSDVVDDTSTGHRATIQQDTGNNNN